jgi:hypothetical protein
MHLSDVFKFTQGLGQIGHQIGRKVGDAIELVTLAMVYRDEELSKFLEIENGVEGATTAKHKVEFAFYNLDENGNPTKNPEDLFGIIECKKVGVEQTVKQNFKTWKSKAKNKKDFNVTDGYVFTISPTGTNFKWSISVSGITGANNIRITSSRIEDRETVNTESFDFNCQANSQVLIGHDIMNELFILGPTQQLSEVDNSIKKCVVVQIKDLADNLIKTIHVNECLRGPQTPEKAKQASFVSLDVRKKVLGRFDKTDNNDFVSMLVIGEASHWEEKSRSMIRLCNDFNLIVPDKVLVKLFQDFQTHFGANYQTMITKTNYGSNENVRNLVDGVIAHYNSNVLFEMGTENFVEFEHFVENDKNKVRLKPRVNQVPSS